MDTDDMPVLISDDSDDGLKGTKKEVYCVQKTYQASNQEKVDLCFQEK